MLESVSPGSDRYEQLALVITADCDLAHQKHGGLITCVPILTADHYIAEFGLHRERAKTTDLLFEDYEYHNNKEDRTGLSREALLEICGRMPAPQVIEHAGISEDLSGTIHALCELATEASDISSAREQLKFAGSKLRQSKTEAAVQKRVADLISNTLKNTPGDALFLSRIAPNEDRGYFAYLRRVETLYEDEISISPGTPNVKYRRISRLRDTYIHALSQRFASVFMAIGLPDAYENSRNSFIQHFGGKK